MNANLTEMLDACTRASHGSTSLFPQIVARLAAEGVERYHADLRRSEKTYYLAGGDSYVSRAEPVDGAFAERFDPAAVTAAVRASQAGEIDYDAFLTRIAAAGCVDYIVSLAGRRAVYLGRTGEACVEHFPQ